MLTEKTLCIPSLLIMESLLDGILFCKFCCTYEATMHSFCLLTSMALIPIPNCSLLHCNNMNSLKRLFLEEKKEVTILVKIRLLEETANKASECVNGYVGSQYATRTSIVQGHNETSLARILCNCAMPYSITLQQKKQKKTRRT